MNQPPKYKRLVLIGFRCTGKSTLSKMLSAKLELPVYSTDQLIEQITGMPIADFVSENGWERFRDVESEAIRRAVEHTRVIIDCGGGVIENQANMRLLGENALVVWVDASKADILSRMQIDDNRPLLSGKDLKEDIETNYNRREPIYRSYGMLKINTSKLGKKECVAKISTAFNT